jgi:parallel beta-helix repeat protein
LTIGYFPGFGQYLNGNLDEVTIPHRSLSHSEIAELYNLSVSGGGIHLCNSTENDVISNNVSQNQRNGIYLQNSSGNTLAYNILGENEGDGIRLDDSHGNLIEENTVYGKIEEAGLAGYWRMDEEYWEGAV